MSGSYFIELSKGVFIADFQRNQVNQIAFTQKEAKFATNFSKEMADTCLPDIKKKFPQARVVPRGKAMKMHD